MTIYIQLEDVLVDFRSKIVKDAADAGHIETWAQDFPKNKALTEYNLITSPCFRQSPTLKGFLATWYSQYAMPIECLMNMDIRPLLYGVADVVVVTNRKSLEGYKIDGLREAKYMHDISLRSKTILDDTVYITADPDHMRWRNSIGIIDVYNMHEAPARLHWTCDVNSALLGIILNQRGKNVKYNVS